MGRQIRIGDHSIRILEHALGEFLSLTDLAKLVHEDSSRVIAKWMELLRTIDFLAVWERENNPNFLEKGFFDLRMSAGVPSFFLSPKQWIERTRAVGIESKSGRHGGGTFAHHLIALEFCSTMDAEFRFKVFREYTQLRQNQAESWLRSHDFFLQRIEDNALENMRLATDLRAGLPKIGDKK